MSEYNHEVVVGGKLAAEERLMKNLSKVQPGKSDGGQVNSSQESTGRGIGLAEGLIVG